MRPLIPLQGPKASRREQFFGLRNSMPRGLAFFLGAFAFLNVIGEFRAAHFDANLWWIDLRFLPGAIARPFVLLCALVLIAFAIWPPRSIWRRLLTVACTGSLGVVALSNAARFYLLLVRGGIASHLPISLSLMVGGALALVVLAAVRKELRVPQRGELVSVIAVALACAVCFPLAQMFCFGKTDYRRPADAAVVLGARVYADGRPSDALADRVCTACQLYRDGLVRRLIFSGGPGDGAVSETEAMRRMALKLGVTPADIIVDPAGLNTQATVRNTEAVFSQVHASRVLVVSHFYHLPRIKLAYQREGLEVYTVPAKETCLLRQIPYNMAREVAALWVYYFRPLA
jgi:vancomycin permeability regulator SanA